MERIQWGVWLFLSSCWKYLFTLTYTNFAVGVFSLVFVESFSTLKIFGGKFFTQVYIRDFSDVLFFIASEVRGENMLKMSRMYTNVEINARKQNLKIPWQTHENEKIITKHFSALQLRNAMTGNFPSCGMTLSSLIHKLTFLSVSFLLRAKDWIQYTSCPSFHILLVMLNCCPCLQRIGFSRNVL